MINTVRKYGLFVIILLLVPGIDSLNAQDNESVGIVTAVTGSVTVTSGGVTEDVAIGTEVFMGDLIETSSDSGVKILFDDESLIALGDNTSIEINEFLYTPSERNSITNITKGKMRAIYKKIEDVKSTVEIRTPNGVAGIKGTVIYVNADDELFCLREGQVVVRDKDTDYEVTLNPNQFTQLIDGEPIPPEPITEEMWLKFKRETDLTELIPDMSLSYLQQYPGMDGSDGAPSADTFDALNLFPSVPPVNLTSPAASSVPIDINVNIN